MYLSSANAINEFVSIKNIPYLINTLKFCALYRAQGINRNVTKHHYYQQKLKDFISKYNDWSTMDYWLWFRELTKENNYVVFVQTIRDFMVILHFIQQKS